MSSLLLLIFVIVFVVVVVVDSTENIASSKLIEDQIYWSSNIDRSTNSNNDFDNEIINWIDSISKSKFIRFESGCGRMQNRLLITDQGDKICARYRHNNEQIFGEYYSFLLARILQISNVLPTTLITYNVNDRWKSIANLLSNNQTKWKTNKTIVLTKYLKNLKPTLIPRQFRSKSKRLYPIYDDLNQNQTTTISDLIQWSDLIIFDYLTGNTDRMINNMINENWNPQMMENPVHNLLKQQQQQQQNSNNDDKLIFIDNESGLFHGYRLLKRYEHLHRSLLDGLCIFRRSTIENLEKISQLKFNQFLKLLQNYFDHFTIETDKNSKNLMPTKNFNILRQRIKQILKQVEICKEKQFSLLSSH